MPVSLFEKVRQVPQVYFLEIASQHHPVAKEQNRIFSWGEMVFYCYFSCFAMGFRWWFPEPAQGH